jgi:hypothetical protein
MFKSSRQQRSATIAVIYDEPAPLNLPYDAKSRGEFPLGPKNVPFSRCDGEEKLKILTIIQCVPDWLAPGLFRIFNCSGMNRNGVAIDDRATLRRIKDIRQVSRQAITDISHRARHRELHEMRSLKESRAKLAVPTIVQ